MPDVTDKILAEITPDPRFDPLSPTVGKLEDYAHNFKVELAEMIGEEYLIDGEYFLEMELEKYSDDLDYQGNHITYEWATNEILGHQMNWVRVGSVAERVRRYRIYKHKFPDWKTYCEKVLGKQAWQMKKIINAAGAVMELIRRFMKTKTSMNTGWMSVASFQVVAVQKLVQKNVIGNVRFMMIIVCGGEFLN